MNTREYVLYSKIVAVLGSALLYWLTGSLWSLLCLLLSAYIDGEIKDEEKSK